MKRPPPPDPRGVSSFWHRPAPEDDDPALEPEEALVSFEGVTSGIDVVLLRRKDAEPDPAEAKAVLGKALRELAGVPGFETALASQYLSARPPSLGPKVTFDFGGFTLHAAASSTDRELAVARAIDRLATVVQAVGNAPAGRPILERHRVSVRRKA